jgi:hypothetical protein
MSENQAVRTVNLEGYVDDAKMIATLRASIDRKRGWGAYASHSVTKYAGAAGLGAAVTLGLKYIF